MVPGIFATGTGIERADVHIAPILKWLAEDKRPFGTEICNANTETRNYWNYWDSLRMQDGLLFKKFHKHNGQTHMQFIVPKSIREEFFKTMHGSCISGHLGRRKITDKILQRFYWYNLCEDVNNWLQKCDTCAGNQRPSISP